MPTIRHQSPNLWLLLRRPRQFVLNQLRRLRKLWLSLRRPRPDRSNELRRPSAARAPLHPRFPPNRPPA
jgi:hypothetical protein